MCEKKHKKIAKKYLKKLPAEHTPTNWGPPSMEQYDIREHNNKRGVVPAEHTPTNWGPPSVWAIWPAVCHSPT